MYGFRSPRCQKQQIAWLIRMFFQWKFRAEKPNKIATPQQPVVENRSLEMELVKVGEDYVWKSFPNVCYYYVCVLFFDFYLLTSKNLVFDWRDGAGVLLLLFSNRNDSGCYCNGMLGLFRSILWTYWNFAAIPPIALWKRSMMRSWKLSSGKLKVSRVWRVKWEVFMDGFFLCSVHSIVFTATVR